MPQNKAACCSLFLAFAEEFGVKCCTAPHVTLGPPAAQAETPQPGAALHSLQAISVIRAQFVRDAFPVFQRASASGFVAELEADLLSYVAHVGGAGFTSASPFA